MLLSGAALATTGGIALSAVGSAQRFDILHPPDRRVRFGSGERFEVVVEDLDGNSIEHHHVTLADLYTLRSVHFQVRALGVAEV
ncbi:MAG: hypothetical protein AAF567_25825 [Actinomycetota bacterium]